MFFHFQVTRERKYRFLWIKTRFLNTSPDPPDPPDPPEMEHELRLATHQQRAGGQDDGSLDKLPQTMVAFAAKVLLCVTYICTLSVDV